MLWYTPEKVQFRNFWKLVSRTPIVFFCKAARMWFVSSPLTILSVFSHFRRFLLRFCDNTFKRLDFEGSLSLCSTIPDSSCAGTKTWQDGASIHTWERWFWRDFCNGAKLRCAAPIWKVEYPKDSVLRFKKAHFGAVWTLNRYSDRSRRE